MTLRILGTALQLLGERFGAVMTAIFLPAVLLVAVNTLGPWAAGSFVGALGFFVLQLVVYSWLAISIHRIILLNETFKLRWGWRESRFAGWLMLFSFGIGVAIWLVIAAMNSIGVPSSGLVGGSIHFLVYFAVIYWSSQYFLIFPAIAVDKKYTLKHSSVHSEDYRFTTFMVVAVFPVLLSLIELPAFLASDTLLFFLIRSLLSVFSITLGVAMLSVLYRELST